MRPVENSPVLAIVVVFIALLVILNSVAGWIYTYTLKSFPEPVPAAGAVRKYMSPHEIGAIGITLVVLVALYAFFRFTPLGLAMRAAAQNPESAAWSASASAGCSRSAGASPRRSARSPA